jgi:Rrf2 family protein
MSSLIKVSEAASLALHTTVFLAGNSERPVSAREMAATLSVSEAHLAKVLQRLAKVGLVQSYRGPRGGFVLGKDGDDITLLDVYESIEGPFETSNCLFGTPVCNGKGCILGNLVENTHQEAKEYLSGMKLSSLTHIHGRVKANAEKNCEH